MGGSSSSSSSTQSTKKTVTDTQTDNSEGDIGLEAGQGGAGRFSNVDGDIRFEVRNQGLSGEELSRLLEPAGQALETVSKGMNAQTSATGAFFATADSTVDDTRRAIQSGWQSTKEVLTDPGFQLAAGGVVLYMLNRNKGKRASA